MRSQLLKFLLTTIPISMSLGCSGGDSKSQSASRAESTVGTDAVIDADIVVYGATPSGIAAAIEAAHLGKQVILLEPGRHVGGMMANGLGSTDLYDMQALGGLVRAFFNTVHGIHGSSGSEDQGGTLYEPHVAEQAFLQMIGQQSSLKVVYGAALVSAVKSGHSINSLLAGGVTYQAKIFIDSSYEGDLMAAAGVSYSVGRESLQQYGESKAGVQNPALPSKVKIDPYAVPLDPTSGLLPHIEALPLGALGSADTGVMAYNYRLCLSADSNNQIPFSAPANYDPSEFEALGRWVQAFEASGNSLNVNYFLAPRKLPNQKFDLNNSGGAVLSTDEVGANDDYVNASFAQRQQIAAEHQRYMQGLLYFLITDARLPESIRTAISSYGLCKDEFTDNGGWPRQLYVREARRMIGVYVMTQADGENKTKISDPIGLGGYNFDSHFVHRIVVNGSVYNEGNGSVYNQGGYIHVLPYPIPYRALIPVSMQSDNLLVSVAMSASHVAYESLRVEPTYMVMGQAAGAAAALAIDEHVSVQNVNYSALSSQLQTDGQVVHLPLRASLSNAVFKFAHFIIGRFRAVGLLPSATA